MPVAASHTYTTSSAGREIRNAVLQACHRGRSGTTPTTATTGGADTTISGAAGSPAEGWPSVTDITHSSANTVAIAYEPATSAPPQVGSGRTPAGRARGQKVGLKPG